MRILCVNPCAETHSVSFIYITVSAVCVFLVLISNIFMVMDEGYVETEWAQIFIKENRQSVHFLSSSS